VACHHGLMSGPDERSYQVTGMSCEHCVSAVHAKLAELAGVSAVEVDLASGVVRVRGSRVENESVRAAVQAAGYDLVPA
jgi:copper chaperone